MLRGNDLPGRDRVGGSTIVVVVVYCWIGMTVGLAAPEPTSTTTPTRQSADTAAMAAAVRHIERGSPRASSTVGSAPYETAIHERLPVDFCV